ncbi:MAG: indolepyruvate oxidoreductase subunit beta [Chloroflexi bacterium]|nr:indolepyruvate oxidoreductase subunit beta [Chloroflexota bacterium]
MSSDTTNVLFAGVGGQGAMLASEILALVAAEEGLDVKQTEVHGSAQRGGAVSSHVRFGTRVYSPVIQRGEADFVVAFEKLEALRFAHYLKDGGTVVINDEEVMPSQFGDNRSYPHDAVPFLKSKGIKTVELDATKLAVELGNPRVASTVILGVLSRLLTLKPESWRRVLEKRIPPNLLDINLRAFAKVMEVAG